MEHPILFLLLTWMDSGPREGKALAQRHTAQRGRTPAKSRSPKPTPQALPTVSQPVCSRGMA